MRCCFAHRSLRRAFLQQQQHPVRAAAAAATLLRPAPLLRLHQGQQQQQAAARRATATTGACASSQQGEEAAMAVPPPPPVINVQPQLYSVAPMMDWTDVYYRQLARMLSRHTWLYTEMVVDQTLLHNPNHDKFLWFPPEQRPIVCQLGGSNPELLAKAAVIVERYGYDEINLNCGCPSDRVAGAGCFGAAMMLRPQLVADCCRAMREAVSTPITVKCRLGVDSFDSYPELATFIRTVSEGSGVSHFIIHARKCLLKGLNPHQNRTVPPLRYEWVWALKRDFPGLDFTLNGGVLTLEESVAALRLVLDGQQQEQGGGSGSDGSEGAGADGAEASAAGGEGEATAADDAAAAGADPVPPGSSAGSSGRQGVLGVMVGRAAYNTPWLTLGDADVAVFGAPENASSSRREAMYKYAAWADRMIGHWRVAEDGHQSPNVRCLVKPLLGMFANEPKGKKWRAAVDGALKTAVTVTEVLDATLPVLSPEVVDAPPRPLRRLPQQLPHFAAELPPTPPELSDRGAGGSPAAEQPAAAETEAEEAAEEQPQGMVAA